MTQRLRIGIMTIQNVAWPLLVERWHLLDTLGFDSAWVADHFTNPWRPNEGWFEGWTLLAGLAAQTSNLRLGTMVTTITYRNPALLARQALTLDHISNGRLELGLGAGGAPLDHSMVGVPVWDAPERVRRFRQFVEIVDQMLRDEATTYDGTDYWVKEAQMHPAPLQRPRPPLTLAALAPTTIKLAARYANTWNSFVASPASAEQALTVTRERNALLDDECVKIGRNPAEISRSLLAFPKIPETPFDSDDAFYEFVGRYREVGINEFVFYWWREDLNEQGYDSSLAARSADRATIEWIAAEAIPKLRAVSA